MVMVAMRANAIVDEIHIGADKSMAWNKSTGLV